MRVELRYTDGCPAAQPLRETAEDILEDVAPHEHIVFTRIPTAEGASRVIFPGSPMLLVDGREVGPADPEQMQVSGSGLPDPTVPQEPEIREALGRAAFTSPVRLPLRHRRIVLIAALLILVGALLGQLAAWGAVVTLAGLALLAVGFASNGHRRGAQPYMWAAGFAALSWLLATAAIWWEVFFGDSLRLGATAGVLFWVGFTSALITVLSVRRHSRSAPATTTAATRPGGPRQEPRPRPGPGPGPTVTTPCGRRHSTKEEPACY